MILDGVTAAARTMRPCLPETPLHSLARAAVERVGLAVAVALDQRREVAEHLLRNERHQKDDDDST
jgi:hypothetical protein